MGVKRTMAEDWAKKFVEAHNREQQEKQQKEQDAQARRRLAEDGAREKFHQIQERVQQDVQVLCGGVALNIEFLGVSDVQFTVMSRGAPRVELKVDLNVTTIRCEYTFSSKDNANARPKIEPKTLRINSDLDGCISVAENGAGKTFTDDSEVSDFLLRPLLTYIISQ